MQGYFESSWSNELDGEMGDAHVAMQARLMNQALRKLSHSLSLSQTILIFINQVAGYYFYSVLSLSHFYSSSLFLNYSVKRLCSHQVAMSCQIVIVNTWPFSITGIIILWSFHCRLICILCFHHFYLVLSLNIVGLCMFFRKKWCNWQFMLFKMYWHSEISNSTSMRLHRY